MRIAAPLTKIIVINQRKSNTRSDPNPSYAREFMTHTIAVSEEKGSAKDQPSYRMIESIDAEALIKQAADCFRLGEAEFTRKRGRYRQERALVMELLRRYSGLKQRMIGVSGLDEDLVSRDLRAIREKIEIEPKIRKWFQDLTRLST